MMQMDEPGFSLCATPLESLGPGFWGAQQNGRGRSGSLEYSRPERDEEDLEGKKGQDLVANLVDVQTGSTVHWWLAFITTENCAGSRVQQGDE